MIFIYPYLISSFLIFIEVIIGVGAFFIKTKRNRRVGVRIKYAYSSDETWEFTNRIFGIVFLIVALCQIPIVYLIYALYLTSNFIIVTLSVCFSQAVLLCLVVLILLIIFKVKKRVVTQQKEQQ